MSIRIIVSAVFMVGLMALIPQFGFDLWVRLPGVLKIAASNCLGIGEDE